MSGTGGRDRMVPERRFALFDTAIGACAIVWGEAGIVWLTMPEASAEAARAAVTRRFRGVPESKPDGAIADAIALVQALLRGEKPDLTSIPVDLAGVPDFHRRVYAKVRSIPPGLTASYGEVAHALDRPGGARAVGQAMAGNPVPIIIPCHRVLAAGGRIGGYSARGGLDTKRRLLALEAGRPDLFTT